MWLKQDNLSQSTRQPCIHRERYLLHEAGVSPGSRRQQVAHILAHELAHSWFGNMVTVRWWKDIWLNEGFATYFSTVAANHVSFI